MSQIEEIKGLRTLVGLDDVSSDVIKSVDSIRGMFGKDDAFGWRGRGGGCGSDSGFKSSSRPKRTETQGEDGWSTVSTGKHTSNRGTSDSLSGTANSDSATELFPRTTMPSRPPPSRSGTQARARYVSIFKASETEHVDDTIMNTIIRGKLNKFNAANYMDTKDFLCQILDSGQTDFLKQFMLAVFQKAALEEVFCPLYATLLSELGLKYSLLKDEMTILFTEYLNVFKDVGSEDSDADYQKFLERNGKKKYRLGYSQFLAELIKHDAIETPVFMGNIHMIMEQVNKSIVKDGNIVHIEEYVDCLVRIATTLGTDRRESLRPLKEVFGGTIRKNLGVYTARDPKWKSLSNRARFTIMDLCEKMAGCT